MVCGGISLWFLAALSPEDNMDVFPDACFIEVRFSKEAGVHDDVVEKVESATAWGGEALGDQDEECRLPD